MKYKVGDQVKVKSDLREGQDLEGYLVVPPMLSFCGKIVTITNCLEDHYTIKGSSSGWTDSMFCAKIDSKYKIGDSVTIRYDLEVGKTYDGAMFVKSMEIAKGKTYVIQNISESDGSIKYHLLGIDFVWTAKMFRDKIKSNVFYPGTFVKIVAPQDRPEARCRLDYIGEIRKITGILNGNNYQLEGIDSFSFPEDMLSLAADRSEIVASGPPKEEWFISTPSESVQPDSDFNIKHFTHKKVIFE